MLEKTGVHAVSARDVFYLQLPCIIIEILTQIYTSAQNVADAVVVVHTQENTGEFILERNHLSALFVAKDLLHHLTLLSTAEFTVERNRLNALFVTKIHSIR